MTVAELVEKLSKVPQDADVLYSADTIVRDVTRVELSKAPSWTSVEYEVLLS